MANLTNPPAGAPAKTAIARDFGAASGTYNPAARLQRYMGQVMVDRLQEQACLREIGVDCRVLDLGCGTGWFTGQLAELAGRSGGVVTGADLSPGMLDYAQAAGAPGIRWIVADAESLPLADDSMDVVFSNLMIQWCSHSANVLAECRRVLRPGGQLVISTLLDGTLDELRDAWRKADPEHEHVNRFETETAFRGQALAVLPGARITTESIALDYPSPTALLAELKAIGAGFKGSLRRRNATAPGRLRAMCHHYPKGRDGLVYATYQAAWLTCRLPG
ncbi:methyltransferase domain-containing protein [Marinobacter sp. ATCH36]|uniref:methyltransferase domain-containing protein n=1 Tax=Marinobacter sp. ATCH36 TaxID=2945106 RepID=UPI00201FE122|nr:methyltransferase domain-containing protein [Marinobacter sp. ATCH36]MCL7946060.1 methyltransferase domain-containing protein [Marinobacter sp. ATCH36]